MHHALTSLSQSERATLRRAAAKLPGSRYNGLTIGARLRQCLAAYQIIRNRRGVAVGFGHEGFTLTPWGWGLFGWGEERQRQALINRNA